MMNICNQAGLGQVEKVETVLETLSALVKHGAHGAIRYKRPGRGIEIIKKLI
jgi:hypothetical protein